MGFPIIDGVLALIKTGGELWGSYLKKKTVKAEGEIRIAAAKVDGKIALEKKRAEGNINYNVEAQRGMQASWKDEAFVLVWLSILVSCFIPWTQPYVKEGFIFLKLYTPDWFVWALLGMVTASFGLKGWKFWKSTKGDVRSVDPEGD
ncbi:MAG: hypothetical protein ACW99J_18500 [Candidatus Thorarchaeota archaeon]|jgi:hypothetical protein